MRPPGTILIRQERVLGLVDPRARLLRPCRHLSSVTVYLLSSHRRDERSSE